MLRFRPTARFVWALSLGLGLGLGALAREELIYGLVGLDLLLLIALLVDASFLPRAQDLKVKREVDARLALGVEALVCLRLEALRGGACWVVDEPPRYLLPPEVIQRPCACRLIPTGQVSVSYPVSPRRRGRHEFGPVNVLVDGPLKLARRRLVLSPSGDSATSVYPDLGDIDKGALEPELMMAQLGIKRIRKRAEGTEFESLREANLDDELRRIDWRATARRGKLIARSYELERNHEVLLCVDSGRLMGALHEDQRTKLDHAIGAAIRLAAVALKSGDRVGLMSFDTEVRAFARPDKGRAQLGRIIALLHALEPTSADASYGLALGELRSRQRKRALVVFLTDFVDVEASAQLLEALTVLGRRHVVLFVALRNPQLDEVSLAPVEDLSAGYRALAAMGLARARAEVIEGLNARGIKALDLWPQEVSAGAIQAYLALRSAGRL